MEVKNKWFEKVYSKASVQEDAVRAIEKNQAARR